MGRPLIGTPEYIKAKVTDVLRQLNGLSYADALYALEVSQRSLQAAIDRLHEQQVFNPPVFQRCSPTAEEDRP